MRSTVRDHQGLFKNLSISSLNGGVQEYKYLTCTLSEVSKRRAWNDQNGTKYEFGGCSSSSSFVRGPQTGEWISPFITQDYLKLEML